MSVGPRRVAIVLLSVALSGAAWVFSPSLLFGDYAGEFPVIASLAATFAVLSFVASIEGRLG